MTPQKIVVPTFFTWTLENRPVQLRNAAGDVVGEVTYVVYARNQPQYQPLPAIKSDRGRLTTRWHLNWRERLRVLFRGDLYIQVLTYGQLLQPIKPFTEEPSIEECL